MNITTVFLLSVATLLLLQHSCRAAPQAAGNNPYAGITIVKQEENNNIGVDGYHYSYEQSDGHRKEETAVIVNQGTEDEALEVTGSFQYQTPDGKTYRVDYKADKDGFHPTITLV
ncbi:endocuticle structural protein SgAbd-6-like [Trichogramma pretiosum]|uniref:endocuticle structural protein SgAbd-6-like n=1 Tax=Trichogramma pretiosum TaxID=7493 RepID=UPI0006C93DA8|nr:endocuticle structural protein SgAbd-6-like [Trichogramma pretiosum]